MYTGWGVPQYPPTKSNLYHYFKKGVSLCKKFEVWKSYWCSYQGENVKENCQCCNGVFKESLTGKKENYEDICLDNGSTIRKHTDKRYDRLKSIETVPENKK